MIIALLDRILLQSPFPPLLWPTILLSGMGGALIAISQSVDNVSIMSERDRIPSKDNLIGCSLQLLSAIFSAFARILMKRTEHILTSTEIVQVNNVSNCVFPFIYTIIHNPLSWGSFKYLIFTPKSMLAWTTISIGVYSFASKLQIQLVRKLGPGFYSSWVAIRVLGSMILSAFILDEKISNWLEWVGVGLMLVTISIYLITTREWMEDSKEVDQQQRADEIDVQDSSEDEFGDEELVAVQCREGTSLLSKA